MVCESSADWDIEQLEGAVLILVLMEDGLREETYYQLRKGRFVLILVLMEDGLRERL